MQKITGSLVVTFLLLTHFSFAQQTDSIKSSYQFKGAVTLTNKGISFIPSFSLGKPAAIFDLSMGKKKLFFEPQLRFSLAGKPWSFLFWWRYKLVSKNKVAVTLGAHPALNFRTDSFLVDGNKKAFITSRRYLAGELAPNYFVSQNISVGLYYLYSRGLDYGTTRITHFLTINSNISNINIGSRLYARVTPQVYYLKQDTKDGFFVTAAVTLLHKKIPLSVQSIVNKKIRSAIPGSKGFLWTCKFDILLE